MPRLILAGLALILLLDVFPSCGSHGPPPDPPEPSTEQPAGE